MIAFVKGAPDVVLDLCAHSLQDGQAVAADAVQREAILEQNRDMAEQRTARAGGGLPAAGRGARQGRTPADVERDLVFVGLLGMIDPARPEVVEALKVSRAAGLKSIMVTGDYKDTAQAIAREIGLLTPGGLVLTGAEIDRLSDKELADRADRLDVYCRVSPQHKTRIVEALKSRGHVVAMTGDGVNDAPALKRANIGVAMGITGTDVAKQTADMVLTDDNFASIVAAVEQGRIIYSNIRKFVYFLLSCNVGEILIVFGAMLFGMPIPLRPVQLLWLNLVTDGAPALALGLEKGDPDIMKQPPRSPEGARHQPRHGDRHRRRGGRGRDRHPGRVLPGAAALSGPRRGGADDRLRDPLLLGAAARLHRALRIPQHLFDRLHDQPLDGVGRGRLVRAGADGGVRAVLPAVLRHRAARARTTGC